MRKNTSYPYHEDISRTQCTIELDKINEKAQSEHTSTRARIQIVAHIPLFQDM